MIPFFVFIILYLIFFVLSLYFYKDKKTLPLFAIAVFLFTSPSVKIFGLYDFSLLNLNLNRYVIASLVPVILYLGYKDSKLIKETLSILKIPLTVIFVGLIFSLSSLYLFNIENIFLYNLSFQYFIFSVVLVFLGYSCLKFGFESMKKVFDASFKILFYYSVILSVLFYANLSLSNDIIFQFYNFASRIDFVTIFEDAKNLNRFYSLFIWTNQFGAFASLSLIYFYFNFVKSKSSFPLLLFNLVLSISIIFLSGSRTGLILFVIAGLYISYRIFFKDFKHKISSGKVILFLFSVLIVSAVFYFSPSRISDDYLISFYNQRVYFWEIFFANTSFPMDYLFGFDLSKLNNSPTESGYLRFISSGGLFFFLSFLTLMFYLFYKSSVSKNYVYRHIGLLWIILIIIGESVQTFFLTLRYETLMAFIYVFVMFDYLNSKKNIDESSA